MLLLFPTDGFHRRDCVEKLHELFPVAAHVNLGIADTQCAKRVLHLRVAQRGLRAQPRGLRKGGGAPVAVDFACACMHAGQLIGIHNTGIGTHVGMHIGIGTNGNAGPGVQRVIVCAAFTARFRVRVEIRTRVYIDLVAAVRRQRGRIRLRRRN